MRTVLVVCTFAGGLMAADPRAVSMHPFTGQRGGVFHAAVRGNNLKDAKAVWVESGPVRMTVEGAGPEVIPEGMPKPRVMLDVVQVRVETAANVKPGRYSFRMVTPSGVSNALALQITDAPVLAEPEGQHETPETAVAIVEAPVIYTGKIGWRGESDYYAFDAKAGETMTFQVLSGLPSIGAPGGNANGFDPSIAIYEASGSWFDAKRLNRIAFNDEPLWVLGRLTDAYLVHTFAKAGRYYLRVEAFSGQGGQDYGYQFKMMPGNVPQDLPAGKADWEERSYTRALRATRLNELAARGGKKQDQKPVETYRAMGKFALPATLEGVIAAPGEAHRAQFHVDGPQDIAIEVETPGIGPPLFNPVVRVLDAKGDEVVTNFFAGRGACTGALNKGLTAKTIYPLRNPGDYTVEVRELTADNGEAGFRYRVQVRPQVPHLGAVRIEEDHINLGPGGAKTVRVSFDREENYRGAVAVAVENLPEGVSVLAAADYEPDKDPPMNPGKRERYVPRTERTVLAFSVAEGAPLMELPKVMRVIVRPLVDGKPGVTIASKQIPMMVVAKP
ncbi:MAG: hypothetical protein HYX27_15600 [Acidobacteria bacterium]|nr:hypothetical protein [Acidobacteriota bacterium]